jgi:predicted HTH transcriptional regulator
VVSFSVRAVVRRMPLVRFLRRGSGMTEKQDIEYKESWRDEHLKWVAGFANARGGVICVGKDDDGKTVGIRNSKKLMADIPNKIRNILGVTTDHQSQLFRDGVGDQIPRL